ncbi:MAG: alanine--tRNA ligase [Ignavibacteriales bacterium]|nr:alanine--tRNA ligase [Ignavibacteriales bacterium]
MTSKEIRNSFIKYFEERGHKIVLSAPVIPHDDPTLLFTNAGMNQFKDVFLGTGKREYKRAADTQKCIRVSGKHNDLEEVGRDTYHHTFFEMLGNWSFGDYYKKEAIEWAWDLLTRVWGLDKKRLYATVYESDDEAEELWKKVTDIDPSHVLRFGKKDNFWEMGETGPCGPCSEIHVDLTDDLSGGNLVNAGDPRVMEIWNLVFIQYNRDDKGTLTPLPAKHVDTGMGFERICAVMQGKKSNYDTDVFMPIINRISEIAGKPYKAQLNDPIDIAMRVVADHARMLSFSIADGGIPSNEGRGYVMRRILRRGARFGRTLGLHEPFIYKVVESVVKSMGEQFPEIKEKQNHIERVIKGEEESFNQTLDRGITLFENEAFTNAIILATHTDGLAMSRTSQFFHGDQPAEVKYLKMRFFKDNIQIAELGLDELIGGAWKHFLKTQPMISGEDAFKLYDTYGFPLDLTEMMAAERGLTVDVNRFTELMEEQKKRSREIHFTTKVAIKGSATITRGIEGPTFFIGYDHLESTSTVNQVIEDINVTLDQTPLYVESGGQVNDTGIIEANGFVAEVIKSFRTPDQIVHQLEIRKGSVFDLIGKKVYVKVDAKRRNNIERNHTATHLLHEALRMVLGDHLQQQGSLVAPDRLRFDFNHFEKITPDQIKKIEDIVNEKIAEALPVTALNDPKDWLSIEEAKRQFPKLKMFFGEKYGDKVRVVAVKDFCAELCGGTHVKNTKDIQLFKIVSEASIASGIRRIEAVTGDGLKDYIKERIDKIGEMDAHIEKLIIEKEELEKQLGQFTKVEPSIRPSLGKISLPEIITSKVIEEVENTINEREQTIEAVSKSTIDLKKELSKYRVKEVSSGIDSMVAGAELIDNIKIVVQKVEVQSVEELQSLGDALRSKLGSGVGLLATVMNEKISLVCVVTDDLIKNKKLQAGKIVGDVAKLVGGGGGGRPHLATAGGKDVAKLDEALKQVGLIVKNLLK